MQPMKLDLNALAVDSFDTQAVSADAPNLMIAQQDPFCCTGCVSGCGINPTASGCASGGGDPTLVYAAAI